MKRRPSFKPYQQHQMTLLPINFDDIIPKTHLVRVIDEAIEKMNVAPLFNRYEGGGAPAYNPVMMLKVIVYAYADKIYSSRNIAKATRENIRFVMSRVFRRIYKRYFRILPFGLLKCRVTGFICAIICANANYFLTFRR